MRYVALVVRVSTGVRLVDSRYGFHILRFLLRRTQIGLRFGDSGFGSRFALLLLGFGFRLLRLGLLCSGFVALFLFLRGSLRLLFLLLGSRFLAFLGGFGFRFFAFLCRFGFFFLALRLGLRLVVSGIYSRNAVINYGYQRGGRCQPHRHQKYADDSFHVRVILYLGCRLA